ncbi:hypothetical protein GGR51DRAFT_432429 [Nemania sp. FL0031]|nr:hypothetical protein GGR51DRAFT_432429 [Nemania sp. FL0031]
MMTTSPNNTQAASPNGKPTTLHISDKAALATAWRSPHPILTHINADTTWVLHLPYPEDVVPPPGRSRFNILLDPWLQGPQSDGGRWFSVHWHTVAPSVQTIKELNELLSELEHGIDINTDTDTHIDSTSHDSKDHGLTAETGARGAETQDGALPSYIDAVAICHDFTDHCHEATLLELPPRTPIFAPSKPAQLIRSWQHFDTVVETPAFVTAEAKDWRTALHCAPLPSWVGLGHVVTPGNALYYHSALVVAWGRSNSNSNPASTSPAQTSTGDAIIYTPHGISPESLSGIQSTGLRTLVLLHGLDEGKLAWMKQLSLGGVNGVAAARACGAKYWIATHDEPKKGGGVVQWLLKFTRWSLADAVERDRQNSAGKGVEGDEQVAGYEFVELGSGDGLVLE